MQTETTTVSTADLLGGGSAPETKTETTTQEPQAFSLPEEYQNKGWAKGIDSLDSLLKQFDNAQSLIGKKTIGVPADDAPPEEWQAFYNKMGRPEDPKAYEFDPQAAPEGLELPEEMRRTAEEEELLKSIFHEAGLTKAQAKAVLQKTDSAFLEKYKENIQQMTEQKKAKDTEFVSLLEKHFGQDKDNVVGVAETLLKKYVPQGMEDYVRSLDNQSMLALSSVLYKMHKEARAEGSFEKSGESVTPAVGPKELRAEALKIMSDPSYQDPFNKNRDQMLAKVKELYATASRLESRR
jgi:hypothetical protein